MPSLVNINSISPDLRDILLGMNLKPSQHIKDNTYTQFLNTHTPIGNPYTIAYKNTVTQGKSLQAIGTVYRQFNYVANKYEGEGNDYEDVGARITNVILPNSSGNKPYDVKGFTDTFPGWDKDNIFVTVPSSPYTYNPYTSPKEAFDFNIIKNIKFKPSANKEKDYSLTYFKAKPADAALKQVFDSEGNQYGPYFNLNKYKGIPTDISYVANSLNKTLNNNTGTEPYDVVAKSYIVPNIYNSTPTSPFTDITDSSIKNNSVPYIFNSNISEFRTAYQYGLGIFKAKPADAALTLTYDDKGILYGPNFNLNKYVPPLTDSVYVGSSLDFKPIIASQKGSYLTENGKLNVEGTPSDDALGTLSSLINGGVGINSNGSGLGVVNNIDVRNSIVGRALTAGGKNDTNLGIIAGERLAISLANNTLFKLQKETIGKVNLDIFSYFDNNSSNNKFIKPNYEITVIGGGFGGTVGKYADFLGDLAGFTLPMSQMKTEFFSFDDDLKPTLIGNIARANGMIETTGKGQVLALFRNMQANINNSNFSRQGYSPGFERRENILFGSWDAPKFNIYAYGDETTGEILENTNYGNSRWTDVDGSGFEGDYFRYKTIGSAGNTGNNSSGTESDFIWADETINIDKNQGESLIADADEIFGYSPEDGEVNSQNQTNRKSILYKTKELFKNSYIQTMVNGHVTMAEESQIQSAVLGNGMMSKGNAALTSAALRGEFTDKTNIFCRTWTPMDKYDQVADLVRHKALYKNGGDYTRNGKLSEFSVLENTGFVKIAKYFKETNQSSKRYMFSIENLAWIGSTEEVNPISTLTYLINCEKGPNGGRIMWFPPYDIKFSESTSVNWDKHNFIGRGEPMYTYNNTERTGQLSFKIIIDHPNHINVPSSTINSDDQRYASFFAGCNELELPKPKTKTTKETIKTPIPRKPKVVVEEEPDVKPPKFNIFFPNDNWNYPYDNQEYESGLVDESGAGNIKKITLTKYKAPINYNEYMGKIEKNDATIKGPLNPINMTAQDYNTYKIMYNGSPVIGQYYGTGMVYADKPVVGKVQNYIDRTNFGLNANRFDANITDRDLTLPGSIQYENISWGGWLAQADISGTIEVSYLEALKEHLHWEKGPCRYCIVKLFGYASVQGSTTNKTSKNQTLSDNRANTILKYFEENILDPNDPNKAHRIQLTQGKGETNLAESLGVSKCTQQSNQDELGCKLDRRVIVDFEVDNYLKPAKEVVDDTEEEQQYTETTVTKTEIIDDNLKKRYEECNYFAKIAQDDPFTYKEISDKIKFFSPAFHSTTPEGFNSRLTFLQQCTRQGPSKYTDTSKPDNLVFGRPPVCVLRIGDFYHTKIIIENMSFDYEPLVWDLNPEGAGVQPMIVNVNMNFAFIGGSSLDGPISKLQNALSANYFANTGLFDVNADTNNSEYLETKEQIVNPNDLYEDNKQSSGVNELDTALTNRDRDRKTLDEAILDVRYDDFGVFQGKVKAKLTVKNPLTKDYSIRLRTAVSDSKRKTKEGEISKLKSLKYDKKVEAFKRGSFDDSTDASGNTISIRELRTINDDNTTGIDFTYFRPPNIKTKISILGDEEIDVTTIKTGELDAKFTSKSKTTNSLQAWAYYFTDTYSTSVPGTDLTPYQLAQNDLTDYVASRTVDKIDMTSEESDGWDFIMSKAITKEWIYNAYNYDFVVEIDELDFKKTYTARWEPRFKVKTPYDKKSNGFPDPTEGIVWFGAPLEERFTYSYTSYLSGGKLGVVNKASESDEFKTANEQAKAIKAEAKVQRQENKEQRQNNRALRRLKRSDAREARKAGKAKDNGSLL